MRPLRSEWQLPKHIILCATIRHLYCNKQLTTILNRLGHCETYDFGLELEASLAKALDEVSINLTQQIITGEGNDVFHLEWDNLNKVTTNIHDSNVVNSTGGIMIQEVKHGFDATSQHWMLPLYERSKMCPLKVDTPETLSPVRIYNQVGPAFPVGTVVSPLVANTEVTLQCLRKCHVWSLARVVGSSADRQLVPGFHLCRWCLHLCHWHKTSQIYHGVFNTH